MLILVNRGIMVDKYYTPQEIAELLQINYMTVYRWIRAGKLEAYQIQKKYRIREADFSRFMEANKKVHSKPS